MGACYFRTPPCTVAQANWFRPLAVLLYASPFFKFLDKIMYLRACPRRYCHRVSDSDKHMQIGGLHLVEQMISFDKDIQIYCVTPHCGLSPILALHSSCVACVTHPPLPRSAGGSTWSISHRPISIRYSTMRQTLSLYRSLGPEAVWLRQSSLSPLLRDR